MANYQNLLNTINGAIQTNGTGAITGQLLQTVLDGMVTSLGAGYQYMGVATPSTNPGTPDQNVFYIAGTEGTYTNFNNIVVANEVAALVWNGSWSKQNTGIKFVSVSQNTPTGTTHTRISVGGNNYDVASVEDVSQLGQEIQENMDTVHIRDFVYPITELRKIEDSAYIQGRWYNEAGQAGTIIGNGEGTDIIEVSNYTKVLLNATHYAAMRCLAYNVDMEIIERKFHPCTTSKKDASELWEWELPTNAKYIAICSLTLDTDFQGDTYYCPNTLRCYLYAPEENVVSGEKIDNFILGDAKSVGELECGKIWMRTGVQVQHVNFGASGMIPIGLYQKLIYTCSQNAGNENMLVFNQRREVIKSFNNFYTSLDDAKNCVRELVLPADACYVAVSSLLTDFTVQGVTYLYPRPRPMALLGNRKKIAAGDVLVQNDSFTFNNSYVHYPSGTLMAFDGVKSTDFIPLYDFKKIIFHKLSAWVVIGCGFYSSDSEESVVSVAPATSIDTTIGERVVKIPDGAHYVRFSNAYIDFTRDEVFYGKIEQPIIQFSREDFEIVTKDNKGSGKSFMGEMPYALPSDFDYSQVICYGQSFADGGFAAGGSQEVVPNAYMLGDSTIATSGSLTQLAATPREFPVVSCVNVLASLYNRLCPKDGYKFIGSTGGANGRVISVMSEGTQPFIDMTTRCQNIQNAVQALGKTAGCVAIVWFQGESDYTPNAIDVDNYTNDKNTYKARLLQIKNDLQEMVQSVYGQTYKPLFFVYETSRLWIRSDPYSQSDNSTLPISMAQYELAQENDDVILISPAYFMTTYDNGHPTQNGYRWLGSMAAKAIWETIYKNIRFSNAKIVDVTYSKNVVKVQCYVPVLPLKIDTHTLPEIADYGFQVRGDGENVPITKISIEENVITIETSNDLSLFTAVDFSFAGRYRDGSGNICDSDNWKSVLRYMDDSQDHGSLGTSQIVQYPTNEQGQLITGKHYPMQNFISPYYKRLK